MTVPKKRKRTKREVVPAGEYMPIPLDLAADPAVPFAAKVVFGALVNHLRGRSTSVWPSIARIAQMVGGGERTVRRAIQALQAGGYVDAEDRPGRTLSVSFPDPGFPPDQDLGQNDRPQENPGQNDRPADSAGTPAKMTGTPAKTTDKAVIVSTQETPPQGDPISSGPGNLKTTTTAIGKAYLQATGSKMPSSWRRHIEREWKEGDREGLGDIDAEVLAAAWSDAAMAGLGFHLTNVVAFLHKRKAAQALAKANKSKAEALADAQAADRQAQADAEADQKAQALARLEAFRKYPEADRRKWIAEASKQFPHFRTSTRIESMAAYLAEQSLDDNRVLEIEA